MSMQTFENGNLVSDIESHSWDRSNTRYQSSRTCFDGSGNSYSRGDIKTLDGEDLQKDVERTPFYVGMHLSQMSVV